MSDYDDRLASLMRNYLGTAVLTALADPDVEEVYVNPDMRVRCVTNSKGRITLPETVEPYRVESFLRAVATQSGTDIGPDKPFLSAALSQTLGKCRIQGFLPPLTEVPAVVIRKPPSRLIPLDEYVRSGILSENGLTAIRNIVAQRHNVIVAGPTASGKTTLCNAILGEISAQFPNDRILVLEDTPELRIPAKDHLRLHTTAEITMQHLVKFGLRCTPDRIIVGEVRDRAARDLLDAWLTGHPGGCGTVHGEDCERALSRLARLASDGSGGTDQRTMVAESVQYVLHIAGHGRKRQVEAMARVRGVTGKTFQLEYVAL